MADVPKDIMAADAVAYRWKFSDDGEWHYGNKRPGPFRFGDPDIIEPLFSEAALLSERERRTAQGVTDEAVDAACCAMAITIARQDGFVLTKAGYEHGKRERPEAHALMVEYVTAGLLAAAPSLSTSAGGGE